MTVIEKVAASARIQLSNDVRERMLTAFIEALQASSAAIIEANAKDLAACQDQDLIKRLRFDESKLQEVIAGIEVVRQLPDPLGVIELATELDKGLVLERVTVPIGVIAVIFEARPDALVQIASLAIKSGNGALLKGGKEAEHTNKALFAALVKALEPFQCQDRFALFLERQDVARILAAKEHVDLVIPRGGNALVSWVMKNTEIAVLGHSEGICHVYVDGSANIERAIDVAVDSKVTYPAACNAAETLLLDRALDKASVDKILEALIAARVELREGDAADFRCEYGARIINIGYVDGVDGAISHINTYGSGHTDAIICDDDTVWEKFFSQLRSASVYRDASTRFADGFRYGFGAEVGISTSRLTPRGPVGLEGLVTAKYRLTGQGHGVAPYSAGKPFLHRPLM